MKIFWTIIYICGIVWGIRFMRKKDHIKLTELWMPVCAWWLFAIIAFYLWADEKIIFKKTDEKKRK